MPAEIEHEASAHEASSQLRQAAIKDRRQKLLLTAMITVIGIGASIMSCVGQSFGYRQARALEGIEQQLQELRTNCTRKLP